MKSTNTDCADGIIARCRQLATCTEVAGETTRLFLSPPMREVHALLKSWMEAAGMTIRVDAIGNLRGVWPGPTANCPRLLIGSHLDTVPNAGAFDGILGVVLGLAVVEQLRGQHLPFAIEVIGFSEEEGVRFNKPFLGSLALIGKLDAYLDDPADCLPSLNVANGKPRQQRRDRMFACVQLLRAHVKYLDLPSLRVGII